jgi:hypothetical protein
MNDSRQDGPMNTETTDAGIQGIRKPVGQGSGRIQDKIESAN